jgi:hypothetical protein
LEYPIHEERHLEHEEDKSYEDAGGLAGCGRSLALQTEWTWFWRFEGCDEKCCPGESGEFKTDGGIAEGAGEHLIYWGIWWGTMIEIDSRYIFSLQII